jgi:lipopolysaccharide transport system permease protein
VVVGFVDLLISGVLLGCMMVWYGYAPDWRILVLPLFLLIAIATSLGTGFLIAALTVKYRDFRFIVPFIVQFGLYISPVGFSSSVVPGNYRMLYSINPMVGVIDGFRWALLRGQCEIYWPGFFVSLGVTLVTLLSGVWYFRRVEKTFADLI